MQTDQHPTSEHPPAPPRPAVPVELELGDGSRLVLEEASASPIICRIDGSEAECISLDDALSLSGQPFAGFRRLR